MSRLATLVGRIRWGASRFVFGPPAHQAWCITCADVTDVEIAVGLRGGVEVGRKRCRRCGRVIAWGIDRTRMARGPRSPDAERFVRETGPDRR